MPGLPPGFANLILNTRGDYPAPDSSPNPVGTGHPALLDERVRTAIAMAINKQDLVDRVLRGYGRTRHLVRPADIKPVLALDAARPNDVIPYDIAGANKILDDAGYLDTNGDGVREMPGGGKPLDSAGHRDGGPRPGPRRALHRRLPQADRDPLNTQADSYAEDARVLVPRTISTCTCGAGPPTPIRLHPVDASPPASARCGATPAGATPNTTSCTSSSRPRPPRCDRKMIIDPDAAAPVQGES